MKRILFILIGTFLLLGGCGKATPTTTPVVPMDQPEIDEKLAHRFEQRGFDPDDLLYSDGNHATIIDEKVEKEPTAAEQMIDDGGWTPVKLVIQNPEKYNEQTIRYFEEDVYENYPPPKQDTIDTIASVIYENESQFIVDGLIRNGFTEHHFTLEQLQPMVFKLMTANNHIWIETTLQQIEGITTLRSGEAQPFRLIIPKEQVEIPSFDYTKYRYHAIVQQPQVVTEQKENEQSENE